MATTRPADPGRTVEERIGLRLLQQQFASRRISQRRAKLVLPTPIGLHGDVTGLAHELLVSPVVLLIRAAARRHTDPVPHAQAWRDSPARNNTQISRRQPGCGNTRASVSITVAPCTSRSLVDAAGSPTHACRAIPALAGARRPATRQATDPAEACLTTAIRIDESAAVATHGRLRQTTTRRCGAGVRQAA